MKTGLAARGLMCVCVALSATLQLGQLKQLVTCDTACVVVMKLMWHSKSKCFMMHRVMHSDLIV